VVRLLQLFHEAEESQMKTVRWIALSSLLLFSVGCQSGLGTGFVYGISSTDQIPVDEPTAAPIGPGKEIPDPVSGNGGIGSFDLITPEAPLNLRTIAVDQSSITLAWDASEYASEYIVYRKVGVAGSFSILTTLGTVTTYQDSGLSQSSLYTYKVKARNVSVESPFSTELAVTTNACNNTAGPTVTILNPSPTKQFPSVNWVRSTPVSRQFYHPSYVYVGFSISSSDNCDNNFTVTLKVYRSGQTDNPVCTLTRTGGPVPSYTTACTIPFEPAPGETGTSAVGWYDAQITASDGLPEHNVSFWKTNFFEIKALPPVEDPAVFPQLSELSTNKTSVCPNESYLIKGIYTDNSLSPEGILDDTWLKTRILEGTTARNTIYNRTIQVSQSSTTPNQTRTYTSDAMDLFFNYIAPPSSVSVTIRPDTQTPSVSATFPSVASNQLLAGNSYTVTSSASDDCPTTSLQYKLDFQTTGGQTYPLKAFSSSSVMAFIPDGFNPPIDAEGTLIVTVKDAVGHLSTTQSATVYTIKPSNKPQLAISTLPATGMEVGDTITIRLTAVDNDLTGATIEYLKYTNPAGTVANVLGVTAGEPLGSNPRDVSWQIPVIPGYAGNYVLTAKIKDNENQTVTSTLTIAVTGATASYQIVYLDLDRSQSMPFNQQVLFDVTGNGIKVPTTWLNPGDAYVVMDENSNGVIDNILEFASLGDLLAGAGDDAVLDNTDPLYHAVKVWRDADHDGLTDSGELKSLSDAGIISITLSPTITFLMNL
jgi:hypothetical protein